MKTDRTNLLGMLFVLTVAFVLMLLWARAMTGQTPADSGVKAKAGVVPADRTTITPNTTVTSIHGPVLPVPLRALGATEAPAGQTFLSNGFTGQAEFLLNQKQFAEQATAIPIGTEDATEGGLGPTYNAKSCLDCHNNPSSGGGSQLAEIRVGNWDGMTFTTPLGGSLVRQRAVQPSAQQRVPVGFNVVTRRLSTPLFGLGFVEMLDDAAILRVRDGQPEDQRGTVVMQTVTVGFNVNGTPITETRIGRFGWKCQHGSLKDFAADAQINEKGITSPIHPTEAPALNGSTFDTIDLVPDPEDEATADAPEGKDVRAYTRYVRALRAPGRQPTAESDPDIKAGETMFTTVGCAVCHVPTWTTAPQGSVIKGFPNGVLNNLGGKVFHPYSDFLLHDIGSGDGIVQGGPPQTRTMVRTAPLWGLRTRPEMMHDGLSYTPADVIGRHRGQAKAAADKYDALGPEQKRQLTAFLLSL